MKPSELVKITQDRHLRRAADTIRQLFKPGKFIIPEIENYITLKAGPGMPEKQKAWRFQWTITKEFKAVARIVGGTPPNQSDIDRGRVYVLDVYADHTTDYIVEGEK